MQILNCTNWKELCSVLFIPHCIFTKHALKGIETCVFVVLRALVTPSAKGSSSIG